MSEDTLSVNGRHGTGAHSSLSERTNVLGVAVSGVNIPIACEVIESWIRQKARNYVCVTGVHGVIECQGDESLRKIHNRAGMVVPDGMPLVWLSRLAGRKEVDRVYGPDLMLEVCRRSVEKGWRHFFYGGADGVVQLLQESLEARFPGIDIVGSYTPPFRPLTEEECGEVRTLVAESRPDIVWVGISTPKQERWMAEQLGMIEASVMLGVGAAFDFHAGLKRQAPRWMQRSGLEWFYRLLTEPKRLWRRYLRNNPLFVWLILLQKLGLRTWEIHEAEDLAEESKTGQ